LAAVGLELRPIRAADRRRVEEITADIWGGHDYLPAFFDEWLQDPNSWFQAAELDGELVGLQRMRPIERGVVWYEGLRVASTHRRRGIAREMVARAVADAREYGFTEMRLVTGDPEPSALFRSLGFRERLEVTAYWGRRLEGGDPAPLLPVAEAARAFEVVREDPAYAVYDGLHVEWDGAYSLTSAELAARAEQGLVRSLSGGRALAVLRWYRDWGFLSACFVGGSGGLLRDLLMALRFEADIDGVERVRVLVPNGHPGLEDLRETGYDARSEPFRMTYFGLSL
jgi:GNAT superfamily N-acetyltransferase